jgi:ABC-type uncharacterized transport system involved in gliding motility auxiliary subunit
MMLFAGVFSGTPAAGLQQTVLASTSADSQLIDRFMAEFSGENATKDFVSGGKKQTLALRLIGKFKSAFPEGKPKAPEPPPGPDGKPEEKKPEAAAEAGLKESTADGVVVLIGDADFIQDEVAVQRAMNPFGGQAMVMPANGNLALAQGAIEQLTGDNNLISVRSRASRERQFLVVKEMEAKAEAAYRSKIKELETSLTEAQTKLSELQRSKGDKGGAGQRFILSPEQQQEIANFRKKEADVKLQLKQERKKLRADIDSLENRIKWENIALMPAVVTAGGVGLAMLRHKRRAAR